MACKQRPSAKNNFLEIVCCCYSHGRSDLAAWLTCLQLFKTINVEFVDVIDGAVENVLGHIGSNHLDLVVATTSCCNDD
jgi:hypothetical protein